MLWDRLTDSEQEVIRSVGIHRSYPPGSLLFHHGDPSSFALILLNGSVKLTTSSATGYGILIELRRAGNILGELGSISGEPRTATAVAVEQLDAIVIPAPVLKELLASNGPIALRVLEIVVTKLRQATARRLEARAGDAHARLCGRIVELADGLPANNNGVIEIRSPLTQEELAEWIGVSRDAVVLALRDIRAQGWIETGRRSIRILDLDSLKTASMQ